MGDQPDPSVPSIPAPVAAGDGTPASRCRHQFRSRSSACTHQVPAGSDRCLWHNARIAKTDAYIVDLLAAADAATSGDLEEASLADLTWPGASLPGRVLRGADLRGARLPHADLSGSDLSDANLRRADLRGANLTGANLHGADLSGCDLSGADLTRANLVGALFDGTVLIASNLSGANLTDARILSFRWNRRTRLAGVTGFEPRSRRKDAAEGDDDTQEFLAPLALADTPPRSALDEPDPELDRTHLYTPISLTRQDDHPTESHPRTIKPTSPLAGLGRPRWIPGGQRWALILAVAGLVGAGAGAGLGVWGWRAVKAAEQERRLAPSLANQVRQLNAQHDADLEQLRLAQERLKDLSNQVVDAKREFATTRNERDQLRTALDAARAENSRANAAEDRAAVLALQLDEARRLAQDLGRTSARNDRISRILADGLQQTQNEVAALARIRDAKLAEYRQSAALADELAKVKGELALVRQERDTAQAAYQARAADLAAAQATITRTLSRAAANGLADLVGDDEAPLVALEPGKPLAMSGRYLMTLRVDRQAAVGPAATGQIPPPLLVSLVVQRPAATANPDVTVVLYDRDEKPLRRLSYSFPHVDGGPPMVSSTATISCDRTPSFARVLVNPGTVTVGMK